MAVATLRGDRCITTHKTPRIDVLVMNGPAGGAGRDSDCGHVNVPLVHVKGGVSGTFGPAAWLNRLRRRLVKGRPVRGIV